MNATLSGVAIGAFLAFMAFAFGFWAFLVAAIFMGIGALVGRAVSGKMEWRSVLDAITGRRSSS